MKACRFSLLLLVLLTSSIASAQTPLTDGIGLYENQNHPPADHLAAGLEALARATPIDGVAALLCTGMSNARLAWGESGHLIWKFAYKAENHPNAGDSFRAPGGCVSNNSSEMWSDPNDPIYDIATNNILTRPPQYGAPGVRPDQVRAAWHKLAFQHPGSRMPSGETHIASLASAAADVARNIKQHFPNVEILWFSSRTYGGFGTTSLNPEPFAYESGLAVRRLVLAQIEQRRTGQIDPAFGDLITNMPWIGWGVYLWAGETPRSDGLFWTSGDFTGDMIHPSSPQGEAKVADLLIDWCMNDPMCSRFHAGAFGSTQVPPTPDPAPTANRTEILRWSYTNLANVDRFEALIGTRSGQYDRTIDLGLPDASFEGVFVGSIQLSADEDAYIALRAVDSNSQAGPLSIERFRPALTNGEIQTPVGAGVVIPEQPEASFHRDFATDALGSAPSDWTQTRANFSLSTDSSLFQVTLLGQNQTLTTDSSLDDIHAHVVRDNVPFDDLAFTGRMATDRSSASIGVTVHSLYPATDAYYRLGSSNGSSFRIEGRPGFSCDAPDTGINPVPGAWYRFELTVTDGGSANRIEARIWPETGSPPANALAVCTDDNSSRPTGGTIGVWAGNAGSKFWDDLSVVELDGGGVNPPSTPPAPPVLLQIVPVE